MAIYAKNQSDSVYVIPHLAGPVTLQPKGQAGSVSAIAAELKDPALTEQDFADIQVDQIAGLVYYCITVEQIPPDTKSLRLHAAQNIVDDTKMPRAGEVIPTSAVYFDSEGQRYKNIIIEDQGGAFELEFWGSIDVVNVDPAGKRWVFVGEMRRADPGLWHVPPQITAELQNYRFVKADAVRGVAPKINFQSGS